MVSVGCFVLVRRSPEISAGSSPMRCGGAFLLRAPVVALRRCFDAEDLLLFQSFAAVAVPYSYEFRIR